MEKSKQFERESETRIARTMAANILWRSSTRSRRQEDGRSLVSTDDLYLEFSATYADAGREVFELGIRELETQGKVEMTGFGYLLVDFSTLE